MQRSVFWEGALLYRSALQVEPRDYLIDSFKTKLLQWVWRRCSVGPEGLLVRCRGRAQGS